VWGKRGEALGRILAKGDRIFVEGSLRTTSYEKNGEKRYSTEINATNIILAGRGGNRAQGANDESMSGGGYERRGSAPPRDAGFARQQSAPAAAPQDDFPDYGGADDEIPF